MIYDIFYGVDKLHSAAVYLQFQIGVDTPPEYTKANLEARAILVNLSTRILNELEARWL